MMDSRLRMLLLCGLMASTLKACDASKDDKPTASGPGPNGSYLFVSAPNFYFGTAAVGDTRTQNIEVSNRGGDVYPIRKLDIIGENRDEFASAFAGPITLQPAQTLQVEVSFKPVTNGRKFANIDIDFDTITQVSAADNQNEQQFYTARELENRQDYKAARNKYTDYLQAGPAVDVNKRRAAIKLPVIKESEMYGDGADFRGYLAAMNARDAGNHDQALAEINQVLISNANSYVADDALYLRGYIQLMDTNEFAAAQQTMQQLRSRYPETTYYDTALYSEALALQSLGRLSTAKEILLDLRYRHTSFEALGITLPKDNVLSRVWFERAGDALEQLDSL